MQQIQNEFKKDIFRLWINWVIGRGLLSLLIILSLWIRPLYLPFFAFAFQFILFRMIRRNRAKDVPSCYILPFIMSRVFFWSGVIMVIINLLYRFGVLDLVLDRNYLDNQIPLLSILITAPITAVISGWGYLRRRKMSFCRDCELRHGTAAERGLLGLVIAQIGHFQVSLLFWVSAIRAIIGWGYYLMLFSSDYFSQPDRFVFFILPFMIWSATTIYLGLRYIGIYTYYKQNVLQRVRHRVDNTELRYLMVCGDKLAIRIPVDNTDMSISLNEKCDTPVKAFVHKFDRLDNAIASQYFTNLTRIKCVKMKPMYKSDSPLTRSNVFHFFAIMTEDERRQFDEMHPDTQWMTIHELAPLLNAGQLEPTLAAEIVRFHAIASAYKTYYDDGHRRYKIKHYRPAVTFGDIAEIEVDFNDRTWLYVSENNQDTPFYNMRRFYRKYINGIDE